MPKIVVSKVDASRRQLSAAVRMLFANEDAVAVHTVASAGYRIARDLAVHRKLKPEAQLDLAVRPDMRREFWRIFNGPANFFKHANSDPEAVLDNVEEEINDFVLFLAISCFTVLGERQTSEMRGYLAWFMVSHPRFFPHYVGVLQQMAQFIGVATMGRLERLQQGLLVLEIQRELDRNVSDD